MMKERVLGPGRGNKGMALLITLLVLSLLFAVTVQFHRDMWQDYHQARLAQDRRDMSSAATSGLNIARYILSYQQSDTPFDSYFSPWNNKDIPLGSLFAGIAITLDISDAESKIPINSIAEDDTAGSAFRAALQLILTSEDFDLDPGDAESLLDAITDWIDEDEDESDDGAEQSYYNSQDVVYTVANGPINDIGELLAVRGMTQLLLYGSSEKLGLNHYISPALTTKVNINTASTDVLEYLFPQLSESLLEKLNDFREDSDNEDALGNLNWYQDIDTWPTAITLEETLLTVKSSDFLIKVQVTNNNFSYTLDARVKRLSDGSVATINRNFIY